MSGARDRYPCEVTVGEGNEPGHDSSDCGEQSHSTPGHRPSRATTRPSRLIVTRYGLYVMAYQINADNTAVPTASGAVRPTDPAGLTARARPEARPETRAANL